MEKFVQMEKKVIAAFDFDGTLTNGDSFLLFARYVKGNRFFLKGLVWHLPVLVAMKLRLYPNWKAKQALFSYYFEGMSVSDFDQFARAFALDHPALIRKDTFARMKKHVQNGDQIVVVSASMENWIRPFFDAIPGIRFLCTRPEIDPAGSLTGCFESLNCHGAEKVSRFLRQYPAREEYMLYAYGDSNGDRQLLQFADHSFYCRRGIRPIDPANPGRGGVR